ncbi:MAG TPA: hypothetical protein VJL29_05050 [Thermoguttaceae bacterium]|nr:hypothetical protein [Thermoguttaceae bacterium]
MAANSLPEANAVPVNPYASPADLPDPSRIHSNALSPSDRRCLQVGRVVVAWEKLRILYNLLLGLEAAVVFLLAVVFLDQSLRGLAKTILLGGLAANLCFCAGPLADGYLSWFGLRHRAVTWSLFALGTAFSMLLGLLFLASLATFGMMDD